MSVDSEMTALANSIRSKSGKTGKLSIQGMKSAVDGISTSGGSLPQTSVEQAIPTISVSSSGLITASATQSAGTVSAGTKTATKQLTTQAAKTVTPGTSNQTAVASGVYTTGAVTVAGDANLIPSNIVSGKTIFGVAGSHTCSGGAPSLQDKTVTPTTSQQVVKPDSNYDGLSQVTVNAMPAATQATPSISVNSSTGVITASATQSAGYVAAGTKSATSNLTTQGAKTVTPGTSNQTAVAAGRYTTGAVTVAGDSNLKAANIKKGAKIFGVTGTYEGAAGGTVYPDGAFAPVAEFTDGKQYALVAIIDGVYRYINTTTYNDYTMNATQLTIGEDAGDYVVFNTTPVMFTAVASGSGFMLQNGTNYLHGTTNNGTALRVGTTQAVWTVDDSATGGFSSGKYYEKENSGAVWLKCNDGSYDWSIKYETAGSFGYDYEGRNSTYSTGFVSFVLYEYVAGEGASTVVDTADATAKASDMAAGVTAYVKGKKVTGTLEEFYSISPGMDLGEQTIEEDDGSVLVRARFNKDGIARQGDYVNMYVPPYELGDATPADVAVGKTFTGAGGFKAVGTASLGSGLVVKTGTTTSSTIVTGLTVIEQFFIYKESITATGLIHLHYSKTGGTSYLHASAWSTNNYGTKTITNATTAATIGGGSITIPGTSATTGGLSSGVTYKWVAIGTV